MALGQDKAGSTPAKLVVRSVPLYYFRDAIRLVKILNPDADVSNGAVSPDTLEGKRRTVLEKEADLQKSAAALSALKTQKAGLLEEQKRTQADLQQATNKLEAAKAKQERLQDQLDKQDEASAETQAAIQNEADPDKNARLKQKLADQQAERERINKRLEDQKTVVSDAGDDQTVLREKLDNSTDENKGLDKQIADLGGTMKTAAEALMDAQKEHKLAEFDEDTEISKLARQSPLIVSRPTETRSDDPVRNVWVFAMADRAGLILRGTKEDVDAAEEVVAAFDEPAPQARLSVYEMQVNVAQDNPSRERYAEVQQRVLKKLAELRYMRSDAPQKFINAVSLSANGSSRDVKKFYSPEALKIFRDVPPDPRQFSSFGEAVILYNLANVDQRKAIWDSFSKSFSTDVGKKVVKTPSFERFKAALGVPCEGQTAEQITPTQSEMLRGITARRMSIESKNLATLWAPQKAKLMAAVWKAIASKLPDDMKVLTPEQAIVKAQATPALVEELNAASINAAIALKDDLGYKAFQGKERDFLQDMKTLQGVGWNTSTQPRTPAEYLATDPNFSSVIPRTTYNARVAAADAVVKQIIISFEDDLWNMYLRDGFEELRKSVNAKGVNFGQLKKTSVLVTNRQFASMIARSEAEVSPGKSIDILDDVKRLLQFATAAGSANPAGILGLMSNEDKQTPYRPAEIYGVTSTGGFRVTPAFESTGQALRFRFEYSLRNTIREPNGTVNPRIPMVERQSISNEVQIGNFEIREISSFAVNSQLGLPIRKWGGIPVLKDLPFLSEIPLIGWFHWRGGRSAMAQESIVFGQTAMYPTLGDLINLMGGVK